MKISDIIKEAIRIGSFDLEEKSLEQIKYMRDLPDDPIIVGSFGSYKVMKYDRHPHVFLIEYNGEYIAQMAFKLDSIPILDYIYVLKEHRNKGVFPGFLSILKSNTDMFPILIGHSMSDELIKLVENLRNFQKFWYNTKTKEEFPYSPGHDNEYFTNRGVDSLEWVYMLK